MMPRVAFNFDSLMMALFVNVQLLGHSRCIPSHFSRRKFQNFSDEHALGTPRAKKRPGWAGPGRPRLAEAGPNGPARTGPKLTFLKNANAEKC